MYLSWAGGVTKISEMKGSADYLSCAITYLYFVPSPVYNPRDDKRGFDLCKPQGVFRQNCGSFTARLALISSGGCCVSSPSWPPLSSRTPPIPWELLLDHVANVSRKLQSSNYCSRNHWSSSSSSTWWISTVNYAGSNHTYPSTLNRSSMSRRPIVVGYLTFSRVGLLGILVLKNG